MVSVIDSLPLVRGVLHKNTDLSKKSWLGVSGVADVLFIPEDMDDLLHFFRNIPDIPVTILGAMSNILIRDGGIRGVAIILGDCFKKIYIEEEVVEVGAGVNCSRIASYVADLDLGGLEFLNGIPGTIGGALKMNAGCYGSEISDKLIEFEAISTSGVVKWFNKKDVEFAYRKSNIADDLIITRAWFKCDANPDYSVIKKTNILMEKRKETQPLDKRSCGSTFKNPPGKKAWELIDCAGCRGMKIGGAAVSDKHCNFIINENNATAEDIENLGEKIIRKVQEAFDVALEWEIQIIGDKR